MNKNYPFREIRCELPKNWRLSFSFKMDFNDSVCSDEVILIKKSQSETIVQIKIRLFFFQL